MTNVVTWTWEEIVKFAKRGVAYTEGNLEHEAILVARWLHAERVKALVAAGEPAPAETPAE